MNKVWGDQSIFIVLASAPVINKEEPGGVGGWGEDSPFPLLWERRDPEGLETGGQNNSFIEGIQGGAFLCPTPIHSPSPKSKSETRETTQCSGKFCSAVAIAINKIQMNAAFLCFSQKSRVDCAPGSCVALSFQMEAVESWVIVSPLISTQQQLQ